MPEQFIESGQALESLRNTDFDNLSAFGEVIDNSIQANATKIHLNFELSEASGRMPLIDRLVFADNGSGMNDETLAKCLKLGWSSRYNNRDGIGRFGVGMILGAIHECKRIDVYSKEKTSGWKYTYIDLDEISSNKLEGIPDPVPTPLPNEFQEFTNNESGTIVVWSKYDRQKQSAKKTIIETKHWIGRTFRYFIWGVPNKDIPSVEITVNGESVNAIDPLYLNTEKTNFSNDPKAELVFQKELSWPVQDFYLEVDEGTESNIQIKMTHLPEKFRQKEGDGGNEDAQLRYIPENEGVSILRNYREVFYGTIPYWTTVKDIDLTTKQLKDSNIRWRWDRIDRFWGCEILFNAELDAAFEVKNIKRGALPEPLLRSAIKKNITAARKSINDKTSKKFQETKDEIERKKQGDTPSPGHGSDSKRVEGYVNKTPGKKTIRGADNPTSNLIDKVLKFSDKGTSAAVESVLSADKFSLVYGEWECGQFWDTEFADGKFILLRNKKHSYFRELQTIRSLMEEDSISPEDLKVAAEKLEDLVNLLLVSAAKAQSVHSDDEEGSFGEMMNMLNTEWSIILDQYIKKFKDMRENN